MYEVDLDERSDREVEEELNGIMQSNRANRAEEQPIPSDVSVKAYLLFVTPDTFNAVERKKILFESNI